MTDQLVLLVSQVLGLECVYWVCLSPMQPGGAAVARQLWDNCVHMTGTLVC